jgi:putative toxin-antitoxin system antitoxin component (TIGR02293 family)
MNYVELIQLQAMQVFGNKAKAAIWLNQPITAFDGSTPLEIAHSEEGYELVKAELERVSHGYAC